ncbi:MAG: GSCFA domain-containing protein [Alistipes sp.]|nr:GSCFA domain-containing protein [Alistipes sp.]
MKFRTEIRIAPSEVRIGYENRMLALGSCFAEHLSARLAEAKFRIASNPTGVLFNPLSIAAALETFLAPRPVAEEELHTHRGLHFHYDFHGSFSDDDPHRALARMNAARAAGAEALRQADRLILTFGTAWVYELRETGEAVANCHKQPTTLFRRRRLSTEEIVARFGKLLSGALADRQVILSVSPVRHLGEGLADNFASKATLRLAVEELQRRHANAVYFPAYEILMDDLRDYRFYADDLVHPSAPAIEYIWELFTQSCLTERARALQPQIRAVATAARHRPLHPGSEAHRDFCRRQLEAIAALPEADLSAEREFFERQMRHTPCPPQRR